MKRIAFAQAAAGLILIVSAGLFLFISALLGGTLDSLASSVLRLISIPVLTVSVASVLFVIGTVLRFRIWVPAVIGGGIGLLAMVGFTVLFFIVYFVISFMGGIAASGGQ